MNSFNYLGSLDAWISGCEDEGIGGSVTKNGMAPDDFSDDATKNNRHPARWFVLIVVVVVALIGIGLLFLKF